MKNRFSALLLTLMLLLSCGLFWGCGAGEKTEKTAVSSQMAETEEAEAEYVPDYDLEYYERFKGQDIEINVYNWGEYIADGEDGLMDINAVFEELTGIRVNYTTYETNEAMYAKLKSKANNYDVIVPSDYMISRLIEEDMIQPLDFSNIPNYRFIDEPFKSTDYDPDNIYSVPYAWGRVGIVYNREAVNYEVNGWEDLWNEALSGQILMFKNSRDSFAIALMSLGYSLNSENQEELEQARDLLKKQKPLVQAYVQDQIFDKMQGNEAVIAPCYVGDYVIMKEVNEDLEIFIPNPTNLYVDAMCIPADAQQKEAAELYINFLNEPDVAADNMEYIVYSTPNAAALELLDPAYSEDEILYPDASELENCEAFVHLSQQTNLTMDEMWTDILSSDSAYRAWAMPVFLICAVAVIICMSIYRKRKKQRESMDDWN